MVERLHPDGAADLAAQAADGLQHAELAPPVGDRHGQRVDDAEDRDQHGDGICMEVRPNHWSVMLQDVGAHARGWQHEHAALAAEALEDPLPHVAGCDAGLQVDAEHVDRVVVASSG